MSRADQRPGGNTGRLGALGWDETVRLAEAMPPVPRLGIATRGNTVLAEDDIDYAIERGVRYFNWCGKPDGLSRAIGRLGRRRREVVVATQIKARTADEAERELDWILAQTDSDRLEVGTFYYVESEEEWRRITGSGGAWDALAARRSAGQVGMLGLTTHQRSLAARWAGERSPEGASRLDMLMIRYNAAHTGAERDIFPVTDALGMPVVTFTGVRWRDLLRGTPDDPPGFQAPSAADCYRFCLCHEGISVALAAPNGRAELLEDLRALDEASAPDDAWISSMRAHGQRVHRHAREFW